MNLHSGTVLAIDQSTAATKALLFSIEGKLIDQEILPHIQYYPQAGWVEHDAEEIFQNTIKVATSLISRHPQETNSLGSISITNQRETFVVFDRETGSPLYHAIVWQCRRGDGICRTLHDDGKSFKVHNLTGLKIDTYFPASKLCWLLNERDDLRQKIGKGSALFGTIDTYLIYRLTQGQVYATDHTNASRTLFYDIEKLSWSKELINLFGVEFGVLPEIRESADWYGDTDLAGLLPRRVPIYGVMGDSQAALFAQRCFSPGSVKVTFGTGSSILLNIGNQKCLSTENTLTALGWVWQGNPTYAYEGILNFTGATIAWLRDQLQLITDPAETEELALTVPDTDGVYLIPAFVGLSAPYWRNDVKAAILGMSPSTTRAHIIRAALESIVFSITDALISMKEDANQNLDIIHADGGAVRNKFLMQFFADLNQIRVHASQTPELSSLGAVLSGCLGQKIYSSLSDIQHLPHEFIEYTPQINQEKRNQIFNGWQKAIQQVLFQPKQG
jgi:glycerol kinase